METTLQKKTSSERIRYFDTLRLIAMFIIYVTHFMSKFHPEYSSFWSELPTSLLLKGVTGKLGVVLFGVILGYFAYSTKDKNSTRYVVKRYAFFAIGGFIINVLYAIAGLLLSRYPEHSIKSVIVESLMLGDGIYATYWCIPSFFVASIISYINGKSNVSSVVIIIEALTAYFCGQVWIATCLIGNLVAKYETADPVIDIFKYRVVRIALWIVLFFAIKSTGSDLTHLIDGVCCAIMLILIKNGIVVKTVLNNKFMAYLGEQGMGVFILHPLCYGILGPVLFDWFAELPYPLAFCLVLLICFAVVVLLSIPTVWVLNTATKYVGVLVARIQGIKLKKSENA